jgi:hypothetical protein
MYLFVLGRIAMATMCSGRGCAVDGSAIATYCYGHPLDVSLLATPAKLLTPSLTLPVALDSGRHTLAAFNKGGWALAALFLLLSGCQATRLCMIALAGSGLVRAGREKHAPASIALSSSWACGGKDVDAGRRSTDIRSGNAMIGSPIFVALDAGFRPRHMGFAGTRSASSILCGRS